MRCPDRVTAGWNQLLCTALAGVDPRTEAPSVSLSIFMRGGPGAMQGADGFDALGFTGTPGSMRSPDMEMFELSTPHFMEQYEYLPDSAGAGEWRGGLGTISRWRFYGIDELGVTIGDDAASEGADPAPGLFGGEPAGLNELRLHYPDGSVKEWGSKEIVFGIPEGTICEARNGGGGGYGDPRRRDAAQGVRGGARRPALAREGARELRRRDPADGSGIDEAETGEAARRRDELSRRYRRRRDVHRLPRARRATGRGSCTRRARRPADPSLGLVTGLEEIASRLGRPLDAFLAEVELIVHGTTVATNALLTRRGARTGLICTQRLPRRARPPAGDARGAVRQPAAAARAARPALPAPRRGRADRLQGRTRSRRSTRTACATRARRLSPRASRRSRSPSCTRRPAPAHERRALELCRELLPGAYVTASSDLLSQVRYYDRTSTTVLNAYVGPIITRYLEALVRRLDELRFGGVLLVMQSNGGVATPAEVSERAALSLLSGPASGPTAGLWHLAPHGERDCLTIDMGGTSFDAALVKDGAPLVMTDAVVDRWRLALPTVDIHTIGAGGGSIARVDEGGLLRVGPQSAGASPGPACYGRGGTEPTVTDADLVLGFIDESTFLGGEMRLDRDAADGGDREPARRAARARSGRGGSRRLRRRQRGDGDRRTRGQRPSRPRSRAISRSWSPAAPARCTPPRSRASSRSRCCSSRASRRSSAPRAC